MTPPHDYSPTEVGAPKGYQIRITPPEKFELLPDCSKFKKSDKRETIGYYILWFLAFFGIWMFLTVGTIFVAFPLALLSLLIGSAIDSADRKKQNRDV
jgi:hypothetical protein